MRIKNKLKWECFKMEDAKLKELNEIREALFALYPNATKLTLTIDGEKIKISPNEEYVVPVELSEEE
jgi:hypothetical protein